MASKPRGLVTVPPTVHICQDGHAPIRHNDSEHEMCPLCRALAEIGSLKGEPAPLPEGGEKADGAFVRSFDARDWAAAFVRYVTANPRIATDEGTLVSWFASAIMRGYDEYPRRNPAPRPDTHARRIPPLSPKLAAIRRPGDRGR